MPRANRGPELKLRTGKGRRPVWVIRWFERGRERIKSTGAGEGEGAAARTFFEEWNASRQRKPGRPRGPDQARVSEILEAYLDEHAPHTADPARIGYAVLALNGWWGDQPVSNIRGETCRRYARERGVAPGTSRRELGCLSSALEHSMTEGYLTSRPKVWLPPRTAPTERWLDRPEAGALVRSARSEPAARFHLPLFILVGLYTGARKEAIFELQFEPNTTGGWVDLDAEVIYWLAQGRAETKKRRPRGVPIPERLLRFLRYAKARNRRYVIEYRGRPVRSIKKALATACRRAGIEGVTPHVFRHTCVTWLVGKGLPYERIGRWVGMTKDTVEQVYGHHHPDHLQDVKKAFR